MKKILYPVFAVMALLVSACSQAPGPNDRMTSGDLTPEMELLIGTFKLEGTESAVSAGQAGELVTLWQVYADLSASDAAAQAEIDALVDQIRETMTSEQLQAIDEMHLTPEALFEVMRAQDIVPEGAVVNRNEDGPSFDGPDGGSFEAGGPGGNRPVIIQGGPGPGAGGVEEFNTQELDATDGRQGTQGFNGLPPGLIDALIHLLEERAGS